MSAAAPASRSSFESLLSWSAAPGRELARRAWPIAVSTLSYSAMSLVGAAFVAYLSDPFYDHGPND